MCLACLVTCTATAIPFIYSFSGNWPASVQISKFICLWAIYILLGSVHIFSCSRIGRPILGIYNLLTDTWMWKLGLRPRYSFPGNICFKFFFGWNSQRYETSRIWISIWVIYKTLVDINNTVGLEIDFLASVDMYEIWDLENKRLSGVWDSGKCN